MSYARFGWDDSDVYVFQGGIDTVKPSNRRALSEQTITKWSRIAQAHLAFVLSDAAFIAKAWDWVDDGLRGIDYSRVNRGGSEGSQTEMAALSGGEDQTGRLLSRFATLLEGIQRDARELDNLRKKLRVEWDEDRRAIASEIADRDNAPKGSGYCSVCTRVVSGSRVDRIRSGRCQECWKYWKRHGMTVERPRKYWDSGQCAAIRTVEGRDYECMLPAGHPCDDPVADHEWADADAA